MRSSFVRSVVTFSVVVLCAVTITACSSNDGNAPPSPGVHQVDLNRPLATQEVLVPGTENDRVTIGVLSLDDRNEMMVLSLVFTPDFQSVAKSDEITLRDMLGKSNFNPWLLDSDNLKLYSALKPSGLMSDTNGAKTVNGQPLYAWATFASPEDDGLFDVYIQTAWPAFTDIPVTQ